MKIKNLIIPVVLVCFIVASFAFTTTKSAVAADPQYVHLKVYVFDQSSGEPVVGASVVVCDGSSYYGTTGPYGWVFFSSIPDDTYCIGASKSGKSGVVTGYYASGNYNVYVYIEEGGPACDCTPD